jgi:hypothetical protein
MTDQNASVGTQGQIADIVANWEKDKKVDLSFRVVACSA